MGVVGLGKIMVPLVPLVTNMVVGWLMEGAVMETSTFYLYYMNV